MRPAPGLGCAPRGVNENMTTSSALSSRQSALRGKPQRPWFAGHVRLGAAWFRKAGLAFESLCLHPGNSRDPELGLNPAPVLHIHFLLLGGHGLTLDERRGQPGSCGTVFSDAVCVVCGSSYSNGAAAEVEKPGHTWARRAAECGCEHWSLCAVGRPPTHGVPRGA